MTVASEIFIDRKGGRALKICSRNAVVSFSSKNEIAREFESVERAEPPHLELEVEWGARI
jgi:hypothetical protein